MLVKKLQKLEFYYVYVDFTANLILIKIENYLYGTERENNLASLNALMPNKKFVFQNKSIVECRKWIENNDTFPFFTNIRRIKEGYDYELYSYKPKQTRLKAAVIWVYPGNKYKCQFQTEHSLLSASVTEEQMRALLSNKVYYFLNIREVNGKLEVFDYDFFQNEAGFTDYKNYGSKELWAILKKIDKFNDKQKAAVRKKIREYFTYESDIEDVERIFLRPRSILPEFFWDLDTFVRDRIIDIFEECHLCKVVDGYIKV